ncbi:protein of unknown function [Methylocella tundrae]|uniref:Uncharacterized protein n=1 Tax=Methylocella tundrae TaxID=227605 RepID=A0A4U8YV97_METTU|nr:protein of unknown function [Methylocella tundrae]
MPRRTLCAKQEPASHAGDAPARCFGVGSAALLISLYLSVSTHDLVPNVVCNLCGPSP